MSEKTAKKTDLGAHTAGLEKWLDEAVNKKQPLQLPTNVRKWIAENAWWITLIGGIASLWSVWGFWQAGQYINGLGRWADELAKTYGSTTYATELGPLWYLALAGLFVQAVVMLLAVSKLKDHKKAGWNLIFYVSLINIVIGIVYLLVPSYGAGSLIGTAVGTAISWFFLFQVRSYFTK